MIQNNPKYKQFQGVTEEAEKYINANGGDPETAFRKFAADNGMDADGVMGMIKQFMGH